MAAAVNTLYRNLVVFFTAMVPVVENRGSILLAASMRVKWYQALFCTTTGNFIPVSVLIQNRDRWLEKFRSIGFINKLMAKVNGFLEGKSERFRRNSALMLALVIGVPFTGIGAWAGCVLADILQIDKKTATIAILAGIFLSGIITTACTYGLIVAWKAIFHLVN